MVSSKSNLRATAVLRKGTNVVCREAMKCESRVKCSLEKESLFLKGPHSVLSLKAVTDWIISTFLRNDNLIYLKSSDLNVCCI